ncbi:MAG: GNAT family N-acetyltransferase [Gammaproteobacteria bacterium]|nr:GNAT family N-acetyltransferase [Gammaproteobacteria bacterium]
MTEEIHIRPAKTADATGFALMARDLVELGLGWTWTAPRIARHIRSPDSVVLAARAGNRIAGFAIMRFGNEEAHLDLLAVKPAFRRAGTGRRLMEWLEESALVAGVSVIYLEVRENNAEARAFYEALGYCRVRRLSGYYRGRETAVCMARDLWCRETSAES